jgi:transcription elongation factor GreA
MKKNNKESYIALQEKLRKLEGVYFFAKEKLKTYGAKDCSENSDWILLNENLLIYQNQIDYLKGKIAAVSQESDETVTYLLLETNEKKTIQLTSGETDPDQGKISRASPLGVALNNKMVGEIVEVKTSKKKYQIQIIAIKK